LTNGNCGRISSYIGRQGSSDQWIITIDSTVASSWNGYTQWEANRGHISSRLIHNGTESRLRNNVTCTAKGNGEGSKCSCRSVHYKQILIGVWTNAGWSLESWTWTSLLNHGFSSMEHDHTHDTCRHNKHKHEELMSHHIDGFSCCHK